MDTTKAGTAMCMDVSKIEVAKLDLPTTVDKLINGFASILVQCVATTTNAEKVPKKMTSFCSAKAPKISIKELGGFQWRPFLHGSLHVFDVH